MSGISTPRRHIEVSDNSTFSASFEYLTETSGVVRFTPGPMEPYEGGDSEAECSVDAVTVPPTISFSTVPSHEFLNPTADLPMKAAQFLSYLDLSCAMPVIWGKYANNDWHYRHDPQAMLKALILRRLLGMRWHTDLERYLDGHPEEARIIGFTNPNGRRVVPNHCTLSYFERRLAVDGMKAILDALIKEIAVQLGRMGFELGVNVAIDSTPIAGKESDPDTDFNPYYRRKGYKAHNVVDLDFGLPLALEFTKINDGDSPHLPSLLDKLHTLGMDPRDIYADGAYASYDNLAFVATNCRGNAHFNFKSTAKENKMGSKAAIMRLYKTLWKHEGYDPGASIDTALEFLMNKGYTEEVGAYYWNQYVRE